MLSNDPTICNVCNASGTAIHAKRRNVLHLFAHAQTISKWPAMTSSSKISKAAGAHLDTWAVDRPWLLGTCLQGGGDGWTIEPSQRAMVELFLGAPLAERSSDPINGGFIKKSVCSQIDAWTSHRYIVHTKIIPSFIGFISSHHILQWRDLGSLGSPSTPISKDWSNPSSQRGARHLSITEKALHTDQDISRLLLL